LKQRLPPWDQLNEATLFGEPDGPDGLDTEVASVGVNTSLHAKIAFPWAWDVPKDIFNNYILPYASVNENRNNWRPFLSAAIKPLLDTLPRDATVTDVFNVVNGGTDAPSLWSLLGNSANGGSIVFKSSQTPLIFDPMSTIAYGFASCPGISILAVDALRAAGVAARLAGTGTPAREGKGREGFQWNPQMAGSVLARRYRRRGRGRGRRRGRRVFALRRRPACRGRGDPCQPSM